MELSDTRAGSDHPVMARPAPIHIWRILSVTTPWTWQLQPAPLFLLQRLFLGIGAGFLNIPSQKLKRNYWIWDAETFWFDCLSDWWFGNIFYFPFHIWDNPSHCLIFFKMVETTNQLLVSFSSSELEEWFYFVACWIWNKFKWWGFEAGNFTVRASWALRDCPRHVWLEWHCPWVCLEIRKTVTQVMISDAMRSHLSDD